MLVGERMVVYIDGFNLYHGIHDWARCRWLWLDLPKLARSLRPRNDLTRLHYFTAPVLNDPGGASRQQTYQNALKAAHGDLIQITQGRYQTKKSECRKCGKVRTVYEEKETDVSIAANIVADAARGDVDTALIISADSDLIPAIKIARELRPEQFFVAAFPPKRHSDELMRVLPQSFRIGQTKIKRAQLPEDVPGPDGKTYSRPPKWSTST